MIYLLQSVVNSLFSDQNCFYGIIIITNLNTAIQQRQESFNIITHNMFCGKLLSLDIVILNEEKFNLNRKSSKQHEFLFQTLITYLTLKITFWVDIL